MSDDDKTLCGEPNKTGGACKNHAVNDDGSCWIPSHGTAEASKPDPGRPIKLDREIQESVAAYLERGHSARVAAIKSGISEDAYHRYRKRGKAAVEAGEQNIFRDFHERTERAKAEGLLKYEDVVVEETLPEDAEGRFGKAMEMLRKRYPDVWGGDKDDARGGSLTVVLSDDSEETVEYRTAPEEAKD